MPNPFGTTVKLDSVIAAGEEAVISLTGTDGENISDGLLINQYQVGYQKAVTSFKPLNIPGRIVQHGIPQGSLMFSGITGKTEALTAFLKTFGDPAKQATNIVKLVGGSDAKKMGDATKGATFGGVKFVLAYCTLVTLGISSQASENGISTQNGAFQLMFLDLDVDGGGVTTGAATVYSPPANAPTALV